MCAMYLAKKWRWRPSTFLHLDTGAVKSSKVFSIGYPLSNSQLHDFARQCLADELLNTFHINQLQAPEGFASCIAVAKMPGVTDDEGTSAQKALNDFLNLNLDTNTQHIFSQEVYYFQNPLKEKDLQRIAEELLGNKLIHRFSLISPPNKPDGLEVYVPQVQIIADAHTETVHLGDLSDEEVIATFQKQTACPQSRRNAGDPPVFSTARNANCARCCGAALLPNRLRIGNTWHKHGRSIANTRNLTPLFTTTIAKPAKNNAFTLYSKPT